MEKKIIIYAMVSILFFASCVVNKPNSRSISNMDYNQRVDVTDAHYVKKLSAAGYASIIGSTAAGAYLGSNMNMINKQEGDQTVSVKPANIAIGAIVGLSTSLFINYALGINKRVDVYEPQKWIDKANKDYLLLSQSNNSNFRMVHKSAERSYVLKNMGDARNFVDAFPKSTYANGVAKQSITATDFSSNEYLGLLSMFPDNSSALGMKKQHVLRARSTSGMFSAYDRFPETKIDVEKTSIPLLYTMDDIGFYVTRFPAGRYFSQIENNAVAYVKLEFSIKKCYDF